MAKTQTFGDKLKKKKLADSGVHIKVIKTMRSDAGTTRFVEKFVKLADLAEIEKYDFNK